MLATLTKILEGIGFNAKEADVYLACLDLAGASNANIARKTGLNRITNYEILKRLIIKGIIVSFEKKGVKYFAAVEPQIVIRQAQQRAAAAEHFLPEFSALANANEKKPKISFYEGLEGIKSIYEDSLTAKGEILTFTNPADIRDLLGDSYVDHYVKERVKKKISVRGLAPNDPEGKQELKAGIDLLRDTRLFPIDKFQISNEIMIYDDKIAIFSGEDEMGLLIQSPSLTESFRAIWAMSWENAAK